MSANQQHRVVGQEKQRLEKKIQREKLHDQVVTGKEIARGGISIKVGRERNPT